MSRRKKALGSFSHYKLAKINLNVIEENDEDREKYQYWSVAAFFIACRNRCLNDTKLSSQCTYFVRLHSANLRFPPMFFIASECNLKILELLYQGSI